MAMSKLRIVLNKRENALSSKEKRPHSEIVKDMVKPRSVNRMPLTSFCVRMKRRMKMGGNNDCQRNKGDCSGEKEKSESGKEPRYGRVTIFCHIGSPFRTGSVTLVPSS